MTNTNLKCSQTQMLIRKPVTEVFQAFVDPEKTKHFWFTSGSGKLEPGKKVTWEWEMYNFSTQVKVNEIIENKRISIDWFTSEPPTTVDFDFKVLNNGHTFVSIKHYGFEKTGDELLGLIKDSTEGFTIVLAGLKAYLEHHINLNLIGDKYPKEITQHVQ
jgi:uncharacterized protein YndB with AHSA1/START domain